MDLEIRTGLLESRKLDTLIEITIPRAILLLGWGEGRGQWWFFAPAVLPTPSSPCTPVLGGAGKSSASAFSCHWVPHKAGCEHLGKWACLATSSFLLHTPPDSCFVTLENVPELGNLKLIQGNGETTQSGERLLFIRLLLEAFKVFISPIFILSWPDVL